MQSKGFIDNCSSSTAAPIKFPDLIILLDVEVSLLLLPIPTFTNCSSWFRDCK
jgi:hypothetical protein